MIDRKDVEILKILQDNSKTTNLKVSQMIGLAPSGTLKRIKKLEDDKIIQNYSLKINKTAFDYHITGFCFLKTTTNFPENVVKILESIENIQETHAIVGEHSFLCKIVAKTTEHYLSIIDDISKIENVEYTNSTIVLKTISDKNHIPLSI